MDTLKFEEEFRIRVTNEYNKDIINDLGYIEVIKWFNGKITIRWCQEEYMALGITDLKELLSKMESLELNKKNLKLTKTF